MKIQPMNPKEKQIFYLIFIMLIILNLFLILGMRLMPFIDLPQHLAYTTIYKHIGEEDNAFDRYYEFGDLTFKHNSLYPLFCSLDVWGNVETGNKIYFILYVILLPVSVLLLIKKLNGNPWLALLSFLFIYHFNVSWGFVGFLMSVPLCLLTLTVQYDYLTRPSAMSIVFIILLSILLYSTHVLSAIILFGLLLCQHCIYYRKSFKNLFIRSIVYIPGILLYLFWFMSRGKISKFGSDVQLLDYYIGPFWDSIPNRIGGLFYFNHYFLYEGKAGQIIGFVFILFVVLCLVGQFKFSKVHPSLKKPNALFALNIPVYYFLIYFFLFSIQGIMVFSFYRFSVFVFLGLIAAGSLAIKYQFRILRYSAMTLAGIIYFMLWSDYFTTFQIENKSFDKTLFKELERDKILAGLMYYPLFRGQPHYIHFPDYYITWHRGIETLNLLDGYPNYQLKRKVSMKMLPSAMEWVGVLRHYDGRFNHMDYLLIRGKVPPDKVKMIDEHFEIMRRRDPWYLLRNRHSHSNGMHSNDS